MFSLSLEKYRPNHVAGTSSQHLMVSEDLSIYSLFMKNIQIGEKLFVQFLFGSFYEPDEGA